MGKEQLFRRIKESLKKSINMSISDDSKIVLPAPYKTISFGELEFRGVRIENENKLKGWFIDGSNFSLVNSPALNLSMLRIAATTGKEAVKGEGFVIVKRVKDENLSLEFFPLDNIFELLAGGIGGAITMDSGAEEAVGEVRRLMELYLPGLLLSQRIKTDFSPDFVAIDGSLVPASGKQEELINALLEKTSSMSSNGSPVLIAGLSKTSMASVADVPLSLVVRSPLPVWSANLGFMKIGEFRVDAFISMLHKRASHKFIVELFPPKDDATESLFGTLASLSNDPSFLGYPYPLIKAHYLSKISSREAEYYRHRVAPSWNEKIELLESSLNAHTFLDAIRRYGRRK